MTYCRHSAVTSVVANTDAQGACMEGEGTGTLEPMAQRYERPAWVRRINSIVEATGANLRDLVPIDPDALLEAGVRAAGGMPKGDFGDAQWADAFVRLARSIDTGDLHLLGRLMTKGELLRSLRSRLLMTHEVDRNPSIFDAPVNAPVVVTGPARSGTTILFELLSLDRGLTAPAAWRALHPVASDGDEDGARRLMLSEFEQELWADLQPEFAAIHELRSDLPVECVTLCMPSFTGPHWAMIAKLGEWVPEMDRDYRFHRRILQFLQRDDPACTWLLKTPGHLGSLPTLFETYPDAWVVQTHRDPFTERRHFASMDLDPAAYRLVVVKEGYLFPELRDDAPRHIMALSPGFADQRLDHLPYQHLTRPIYPLDAAAHWAPKPDASDTTEERS